MDELLRALQRGDEKAINELACALLVTRNKEVNRAQANEFEHYARCRIIPSQRTTFKVRCYIGMIEYNGQTYGFG